MAAFRKIVTHTPKPDRWASNLTRPKPAILIYEDTGQPVIDPTTNKPYPGDVILPGMGKPIYLPDQPDVVLSYERTHQLANDQLVATNATLERGQNPPLITPLEGRELFEQSLIYWTDVDIAATRRMQQRANPPEPSKPASPETARRNAEIKRIDPTGELLTLCETIVENETFANWDSRDGWAGYDRSAAELLLHNANRLLADRWQTWQDWWYGLGDTDAERELAALDLQQHLQPVPPQPPAEWEDYTPPAFDEAEITREWQRVVNYNRRMEFWRAGKLSALETLPYPQAELPTPADPAPPRIFQLDFTM